MDRLAIIHNPLSGIAAGKASSDRLIAAAQRDLEKHFAVASLQASDPATLCDLAEKAARDGIKHLLVAGGDGTINSVVNGLMRLHTATPPSPLDEITIGVLPIGTGNVFAFNLGIPREWREACRVIRNGHKRKIDVGLAHSYAEGRNVKPKTQSRYFLLMAGIGYDAKVIEDTSLRLKYVLRDYAYVLRTLQNVVLHQGTQITLRFPDGRVYANIAWLVMIGNAASYAWDIKVTAHAELDDGLLDVCLMPFENKLISIQQALQILTGQHIERGIAQYWKAPGMRVESDPQVPVQLDGDAWATTPVEISLLPTVLNVYVPQTETESEVHTKPEA